MQKNDIGIIVLGLAMIAASLFYFDSQSNFKIRIWKSTPLGIHGQILK
ncbi:MULTISPECIES: hypothetical protein [unclassified Coleofasciculus]|nr:MULTISPECIES: hypothetical protein [unclassified Coleofasciculus]MBE9125249.1 hypothetical protein [Coleofasciculus sp. LEGE 07081]MBE9148398.1 hypothetical protein [Coleofasciculus sp. LEGE 07092]